MKILREKDSELVEKLNFKLSEWLDISKEIKADYKSEIKKSYSRKKIEEITDVYTKKLNLEFQKKITEK